MSREWPKQLAFDPIAEARRHWEKRWGRGPGPAMAAVTSIMRAQQLLIGRLNEALRPFGLTFPRYEALMLLLFSRNGSLPLGKIGERLQVHPTSVTNTIDGLESDGFVRRIPHESDRRATLAEITDAGRMTAQRATKVLNEASFWTQPLTRTELDDLTTTIERLRLAAGDFSRP
ncbi:MAG TPA: MarR family transcriptional regulator [Actinomycetota bacterium]|jgi:DNA-binding MarR family transcriptional regulator|nr:MarR family transcriptional regulator [Actinomycetota bacterium]